MIKYIYVLFFISFCLSVNGQETIFRISNLERDSDFEDGRCDDKFILTAFLKGKPPVEFLTYNEGYQDGITDPDRSYTFDGVLTKVEVYMRAHDGREIIKITGPEVSCGSGSIIETSPPRVININPNPCQFGKFEYSHRNGGDYEVSQSLSFNYQITPLPLVLRDQTSDIAGFEDEITINANTDYNNSVYNWQYGFQTGTRVRNTIRCRNNPSRPGCTVPTFDWFDLNVPNQSSITVIPEDFLNESDIGKRVFFRVTACNGSTSSEIVDYIIRKSAPKIVSLSKTDVSCYDSIGENGKGDATITLEFDRALEPGDNLNITVTDLSRYIGSDADGNQLYATVESYESSEIVFDANNRVTLGGLPHSTDQGFGISLIAGTYNGEPYYTGGEGHTVNPFFIERPAYIEFVDNEQDQEYTDVNCYAGNDGTITVRARGGVDVDKNYQYIIRKEGQTWSSPGVQWTPFENTSSSSTVIKSLNATENLSEGTYYIKIRDRNGCEAKRVIPSTVEGEDDTLGEVIERRVIIGQPSAPLAIQTEVLNEPRAFGFEDGRISAIVSGGTPFDDYSYRFEWRDLEGNLLSTTNTTVDADGNYQITLHSIGSGRYFLSAWDKNFDSAVNKENCSYLNATEVLVQPDPLSASIEIINEISCNNENEYFDFEDRNVDDIVDQFQDGVLRVEASGGVPISETNPYEITWRIEENRVWRNLNRTTAQIDYLSTARYAVNIKDKNGIELGDYIEEIQSDGSREYVLQTLRDSIRFLPQPDKLEVFFENTQPGCASGSDGYAKVNVTGGIPPYAYSWSNGNTTAENTNLSAGTYLVFIEDAKGCQIEGSITIEQPNGMVIESINVQNPICYQGSDGIIEVSVSGGTPPYRYSWNTGSSGTSLTGLTAGNYMFTAKDANNCTAIYEVILEDPEPVLVDLGENRSLCAEQSLILDIGIEDPGASYAWSSDNGFSSTEAEVELFEPGMYTATVITSLGCEGTASVSVQVSNTPIDAHFIITTHAYTDEEIILVNISEPLGDTVEWTVPEGVEVKASSDEQLLLVFEEEGPYDIHLRSHQGDCYEDFVKRIIVQPALEVPEVDTTSGNFIQEFLVYPNPNNGSFKVKISLADASNIDVRIVNLISAETVAHRDGINQQEYLMDYTVNLPSGVYLLWLETPKGSETRKLVVE